MPRARNGLYLGLPHMTTKQTNLLELIKKPRVYHIMTKRFPAWYYGKRDLIEMMIKKYKWQTVYQNVKYTSRNR